CLGLCEQSRSHSAERSQVCAATKEIAEIMRQTSNVCSGRTDNVEADDWCFEPGNFKSFDGYFHRRRRDWPAAARKLIGWHATYFLGGKGRRNLIDLAGKVLRDTIPDVL